METGRQKDSKSDQNPLATTGAETSAHEGDRWREYRAMFSGHLGANSNKSQIQPGLFPSATGL